MRKKFVYIISLFIIVVAALFTINYTSSPEDSLLKENVKALARGGYYVSDCSECPYANCFMLNTIPPIGFCEDDGDDWTCNMPVTQSCKITITSQSKLNLFKQKYPLITVTLNVLVDVSDATAFYSKGGSYRCGKDVSCADLLQSYGQ